MSDAPIQHTPVHERGEVFDPRHPAASAFAPLQPAAGVVADDVAEKGQNLVGGPTAEEANKTHANQRDELAKQHEKSLRAGVNVDAGPTATVEGDTAKPATKASASAKK